MLSDEFIAAVVARVGAFTRDLRASGAPALLDESQALACQRIGGGDSPELMARAFAVCRAALAREAGMRVSDSAVAAAAAMASGIVAQVRGDSDSVAAIAMCVYWHGLKRDGVHLVAVDERDAGRFQRILASPLGVLACEVGLVLGSMSSEERRRNYGAAVTIAAGEQFASDHLRDNLRDSVADLVQRGLAVAVVCDACRTLVGGALAVTSLSGLRTEVLPEVAGRIAGGLRRGVDYSPGRPGDGVRFSAEGAAVLRSAVGWTTGSVAATTLAQQVEASLLASDNVVVADITMQGFFRNYQTLVGIADDRQDCSGVLGGMYGLEFAGASRRGLPRIGRGRSTMLDPAGLPLERLIDEQRSEIYRERGRIRDAVDVRPLLRELISAMVEDWSGKGAAEVAGGLRDLMGPDVVVEDASAQDAQRTLERATDGQDDNMVRRVQLTVLDQQWAEHLAAARFLQRHANVFGEREDAVLELYRARRKLIREYTVGYIVNAG